MPVVWQGVQGKGGAGGCTNTTKWFGRSTGCPLKNNNHLLPITFYLLPIPMIILSLGLAPSHLRPLLPHLPPRAAPLGSAAGAQYHHSPDDHRLPSLEQAAGPHPGPAMLHTALTVLRVIKVGPVEVVFCNIPLSEPRCGSRPKMAALRQKMAKSWSQQGPNSPQWSFGPATTVASKFVSGNLKMGSARSKGDPWPSVRLSILCKDLSA